MSVATIFDEGSSSWQLHLEIEKRSTGSWKRVTKSWASVLVGAYVASWLAEQDVDSIIIVGDMTNNCDTRTAGMRCR